MRKLFLLFGASALAIGAQAQINTSIVRLNQMEDRLASKGLKAVPAQVNDARMTAAGRNSAATANKGTGNHTRVYNYVDYLALSVNPAIGSTADYLDLPYMWYNNDIYGIYGGPNNTIVRDTITTMSIGSVLQPWYKGFNNLDWDGGTMEITSATPYNVDSVIFYGVYGRNPNKTAIVDTVRIALTYGNGSGSNISVGSYGATVSTRYNVDTLRSAFLTYDPATHTLGSVAGGGQVVTRTLLLRNTDTGSNKRWAVPTNLAIPAGNLVGASITFRSGEVYTPNTDTAFLSTSVNANIPFKYGMIRPYVYREKETDFPTYNPGGAVPSVNYNSGQFGQLPDADYYPTWAWYSTSTSVPTASGNQFPNVDFVISCQSCKGLNVKNVSPAVVGNAFPNPANNAVTLPITMKQAGNVNVSLTNLVGQTMATQQLGQVAGGAKTAATFSTAGMANGIYFLTVEANGARTTSRFVVAH